MVNQTDIKWYQKPTGVIILIIFFFPIGLYLMWKNKLWTKQTRWIVTGIFAVLVVANAGKNNSGSQNETFMNNDFYSREATIFGETSRTVVLFRKNEFTNFENKIKIQNERKVNGTTIPSGVTEGKWTWADSTSRTINVELQEGINQDYSGIWKFDENFSSVKCPNGLTLFNH